MDRFYMECLTAHTNQEECEPFQKKVNVTAPNEVVARRTAIEIAVANDMRILRFISVKVKGAHQ